MGKKKHLVGVSGGLELLGKSPEALDVEDHEGDVHAQAAILSAEFPLIDPPLIIALISDYDHSTLDPHLMEIRDQLGILEATLVPDADDIVPAAAAESSIGKLDSRNKGLDEECLGAPSLSSAGGSQSAGDTSSKITATSGEGTEMSRSNSTSSHGSIGKSSNPTSVVDEYDGLAGELELLTALFPAILHQTVRQALSDEPSLPAAIDHLLSIELIRHVERRGFWPGEEDLDTDSGDVPEAAMLPPALPLHDHPLNPAASDLPPLRSSSVPRKSRKKDQRIIPLVDTLQRKASPQVRSRSSSRASSPSRLSFPNRLNSGPAPNAWHAIASLAAYLSEILPPNPTGHFLKFLHSPDYRSAYTAVRACLVALPPKVMADDERAEAILQEIYGITLLHDPSKANRERDQVRADLEICVKAAGADVATVMDLMDLLADISLWPSDDDELEQYDDHLSRITPKGTPSASPILPQELLPLVHPTPAVNPDRLLSRPKPPTAVVTEKIIPGSRPAPTSLTNPTAYDDFGQPSRSPAPSKQARRDRQVHPLNWRTVNHERIHRARHVHPHAAHIPSYALGITPHDATPGSLYASPAASSELSIEECLRRAAAAREKRSDAVRAAGRSFRSGVSGGKAVSGSIAGHYALQAREAAGDARQWEMKAARLVVQSQLDRTGHTIDLHHLTIQEASSLSIEATNRWWEKLKSAQDHGRVATSVQRPLGFVPGQNLTIVTGVGRHSAGRRGVLGPAVANVLEADGWRVDRGENGRGYLVVRGRR